MSESSAERAAVGEPEEGRALSSCSSAAAHSQGGSGVQKESSFAWSQGLDGDADSTGSSGDVAYATGALPPPSLGCWNEGSIRSVVEETAQLTMRDDVDAAEFATTTDTAVVFPNPIEAGMAEEEEEEERTAPAARPFARRLQRSVASASTEGSEELFSFKMRDKVAQTEADPERRSPSPTLFLCRPSKSYSEMKAGEAERLSAASRPSHCFSDIGPWAAWSSSSHDDRPSLNEPPTWASHERSSLNIPSTSGSWRSDALMLRQPHHSISHAGYSSIPERTDPLPPSPSPPSTAGAPVFITRVCSDSFTRRPAAAQAIPRSSSLVSRDPTPLSLSSARANHPLFPARAPPPDETHNLDDAQMRAHAVVYARAKSISLEEACAQLELKTLRARRKNSLPLDAERPSTSGSSVVDKAERKST